MPVNYQHLRAQITQLGDRWQQWSSSIAAQANEARALVNRLSTSQENLRQMVIAKTAAHPELRCAIPTREALDAAISVPPLDQQVVVLAADGSQVIPSRHDQVEFGLLNVGALRMPLGLGQAPQEITQTELLYCDTLFNQQGMVTEDAIAFRRDLLERRLLANLAARETLPVIALTDGPLEPYNDQKQDKAFEGEIVEYRQSLLDISSRQVAAAGYVDRPGSNLVIRMLELLLDQTGQPRPSVVRPFAQLRDVDLFSHRLAPGQRSAVFELASSVARKFSEGLTLHFFYLCVGNQHESSLARVEIPGWVANDPELLNLLHAVLQHQTAQLGGRPYPYALHRAHEVALVTYAEKETIEDLVVQELYKQGLKLHGKSGKQFYKNQVGSKTRYKR